MSDSSLLESFRQAYRNLQLSSLLKEEELAKFRVDYGQRVIAELEQAVKDCSSENNKIIFTGHRGCGKSTLLAELTRKLQEQYFVVFFSIADAIERSDINHINILFSIAVQMMDKAAAEKVKINPGIKDSVYQWLATRTRTETTQEGGEMSLGLNFLEFVKTQLKVNATVRDELKQEFQPKISELINKVNEIADLIRDATDKEILIIIDDLDKIDLDVVRKIYYDHIKTLFKPQLRIIFTVPIAAMREIDLRSTLKDESNNNIKFMEVSKLFGKGESRREDAEPKEKIVATFTELIYKRVPEELIEPEVLKQIILMSGGVLREAINIAQECCSECLLLIRMKEGLENGKINKQILDLAVKKIRNDFAITPLYNSHYQILCQIYQEFKWSNTTGTDEQKFLDLLHGLYILEYRNDDIWYDVHPIVADLLKRRGLL